MTKIGRLSPISFEELVDFVVVALPKYSPDDIWHTLDCYCRVINDALESGDPTALNSVVANPREAIKKEDALNDGDCDFPVEMVQDIMVAHDKFVEFFNLEIKA